MMEKQRRSVQNQLSTYYPLTGPLRRELYPKHLAFLKAGAKYRQRLALAANRVGKTEGMGGYEVALHATGKYPDWWEGKRYTKAPNKVWVSGDTSKTTRDILQFKLLGPISAMGTGLIPGDCISRTVRASGVPDAIEIAYIKHSSGALVPIHFKSYDQGVEAFQGTEIDIILLDEEPPLAVYTECLLRTMTNDGIIMCTFTPLMGMSEVVMLFLKEGKIKEGEVEGDPSKYVVTATWDDVPHLSQTAKDELYLSIPPFQRDARSKGIPQLGAGSIYPIAEDDVVVDDFDIPDHWLKAYGMDVGWNKTAVLWGALNPQTGITYIFAEYYRGLAEPETHAGAIKARGDWIPGAVDPASRGRSQVDGRRLFTEYKNLGLILDVAKNPVESGLFTVWTGLTSGKIKIFKSCRNTLAEYRLYRRDSDGSVVKELDHLMDSLRYLIVSGMKRAKAGILGVMRPQRPSVLNQPSYPSGDGNGWMGS